MSHVATVDVEIKDLGALVDACNRIGLELVRHQLTYKWFGQHVGDWPLPDGFSAEDLGKCDHAIRIPGNGTAYEIGVVRRRDGRPGYSLMWDFYDGGMGLRDVSGDDCNRLRQAYATAVAVREARRNGFMVQEKAMPNGQVQLRLTR